MRSVRALLLVALAVTACQPTALTPPAGTKANPLTRTKTTPSASPSQSPGPTPSTAPSTAASQGPGPSPSASTAALASPDVPTRVLKGLVKMEPGYLLSAGGANVISNNGSNVLSLAVGSVINAGGGSVISNNGSNAIAVKVGLVGNNGSSYRLAADAGTAMLPVQGMGVVAVSLVTGQPLGPAVLTDGSGRYQVTVPESEAKNVLIFTAVPGTSERDPRLADPRLRLGLIVNPATTGEQVLDEDGALITSYMLSSLTNRLRRLFEADNADATLDTLFVTATDLSPALKTFLVAGTKKLKETADAMAFKRMSERDKSNFMHRILDLTVAHVLDPDLDDITITEAQLTYFPTPKPPLAGRQATTVFRELIGFMRPKIQAKLTADAAFIEKEAYFVTANQFQAQHQRAPYTVKRASDVMDFVVKAFLAENWEPDGTISGVKAAGPDSAAGLVFTSVGGAMMPLSADPKAGATYESHLVLRSAYTAIFERIVSVMLQEEVKDAMKATMTSYQRVDPLQ